MVDEETVGTVDFTFVELASVDFTCVELASVDFTSVVCASEGSTVLDDNVSLSTTTFVPSSAFSVETTMLDGVAGF